MFIIFVNVFNIKMKKVPYIFLALMLCLCLAGAASGFQIEKEAVVTPSGVLGAGETVTDRKSVV